MPNTTQQRATPCPGPNRRDFLRIGGLTTLGLSLPQLLQAEATQPAAARKDVNCILLWMGGGPSNIDTFDMKPGAPSEYRGDFRPIDSNLPGLSICEHLPLMAKMMDKVCLLRSVTHTESGDNAAANHYMLTGYPQRPDPSGQPPNSLSVGRRTRWPRGLKRRGRLAMCPAYRSLCRCRRR